jgi:hypothetical protein
LKPFMLGLGFGLSAPFFPSKVRALHVLCLFVAFVQDFSHLWRCSCAVGSELADYWAGG